MAWEPFGDVQFDFDRAELRPSEAAKVSRLATYLQEHPAFLVELEGFADPRGSQDYNVKLTTRRVNSVRDALIAAGVSKERISASGYGEMNPKCTRTDEQCWQQDRRVEMIVLPMTEPKATSFRTDSGR